MNRPHATGTKRTRCLPNVGYIIFKHPSNNLYEFLLESYRVQLLLGQFQSLPNNSVNLPHSKICGRLI